MLNEHVDRVILFSGVGLLLGIVITIILFPEGSGAAIDFAFTWLTRELGIIYVLAAIFILTILIWLAFGRYGHIKLGEGEPEHSTFSWSAMMFCAGIGSSLIYLSAIEWVYYYTNPPFGLTEGSDRAMVWAMSYGIFHWGPVGWAFYCLPALALACSIYVKKNPSLRMSEACEPVLKSQFQKWPGRIVDMLFVIGLIGTAATGLGLGAAMVASAVTKLTGLPDGLMLQAAIIFVASLLIGYSVYRGLDEGIKVLSLINAWLAFALLGFVMFTGPTRFIAESTITGVGHVVQNFFTMLTWTDPLQRNTFVEDWTIFYWAWWIALGPFVGMFVCRISKGRTVKNVILGMLGWGSLGCILFFGILGNFALYAEINGLYPVIKETLELGGSKAIAGIIYMLPGGSFWLVFLGVIALVSIATSYDSASYVLAAGSSKTLPEDGHPTRGLRVFWASLLGLLPLCLLYLGGLRMLQSASVIASIPILFVYIMLVISLMKTLREELAKQ